MPLLQIDNLRTWFHTRDGVVRAVDGVGYDLEKGETLGIVGESGCGKSVLHYTLLGLIPAPPGRVESGTAIFDGTDLLACTPKERRAIRGKRISMIFQDPMTALNPYMKIGTQLMEPLRLHDGVPKAEARRRAGEALEAVGIHDAGKRLDMFPHEFSGGMRQRVMIAMALITNPEVLIADEPTTALDVTVQAQIIDLIKALQHDRGMAMVLITHDLGVIAGACDRVLVMYAGRIVESGPAAELFRAPRHPYTEALLASRPSLDADSGTLQSIPGLPPDLTEPIAGCPFAPRCAHAKDICRQDPCVLTDIAPRRATACVRIQRGEL